jgi:hypothetical protein
MSTYTPSPEDNKSKVYRGIRLDADLDHAIPILLERLAQEKGYRAESLSSFCRKAIRHYYNQTVQAYNERMKARAAH